LHIAGINHYFV